MKIRKRLLWLFVIAVALRLGAVDVDPKLYLDQIKFLASQQLKGRLSGTKELDDAARYIAEHFSSLGLQPAGDGGYFQRFRVTTDTRAGKTNLLDYVYADAKTSLKMNEEFCPLSLSSSGKASGSLVFAGYGITANEYAYDDYAGLDAKGKLVLVLMHEPQEYDDASVFGGRVYTDHALLETKAVNARLHGASALLVVADAPNHPGNVDQFESLGRAVGPDSAGIPVVQVKASIVEKWLRLAGRSMEQEVESIDKNLRPDSIALPALLKVDLSVDIERETKPVSNVLAYFPGNTGEYLILGAHYDHVGLGEQYSMMPSKKGTIHPGADDNASGTAGVLELARWFSQHPRHRRGILFITFAGEEFGLLGSNYYADDPERPLSNAIAMINLDMIGRIRQNKVYVGGVNTSPGFRTLVEGLNKDTQFNLEDSDFGNYGSSDHYSFSPKTIPFLFFFSGLHADYHTPNDTWDKINAPSTARLLKLVGEVMEQLLDAPTRPVFLKSALRPAVGD